MKNFKLVLFVAIILSSFSIQAQEKVKPLKPEKEFIVHEKSRQVTRFDIRRNPNSTENVVEIETRSLTGGDATLLKGDVPTAEITGLEAVVGSYGRKIEISRTGRAVLLRLSDIVYPLRLRITISDRPVVEVELKKPGTWYIVAGVTL